jgi:hypothetical protein
VSGQGWLRVSLVSGVTLSGPAAIGAHLTAHGLAAGLAAIGYANRAWKSDAFVTADAVVTSMGEIAAVLNG